MVHIIIEDSDGSCLYTLLNEIIKSRKGSMFRDISKIEACNGIKNLYRYINNIDFTNNNDLYIVFADYAYDNNIITIYYNKICDIISRHKKNFVLFSMICFEHLFLSMNSLLFFINNKQIRFQREFDYFNLLRNKYLETVNMRENWYKDNYLCEYIKSKFKNKDIRFKIDNNGDFLIINSITGKQTMIGIENVGFYILKDITSFSVFKFDKCRLLECWYKDCCVYKGFNINEAKNKCNLYNKGIKRKYKLNKICNDTKINKCLVLANSKFYYLRRKMGELK